MKKELLKQDTFGFELTTEHGYKLDEAVSSLQKAIRRGDEELALFFTLEMVRRYHKLLWKRLSVISVEDIEDPMASVIVSSMRAGFYFVNDEKGKIKTRLFATKAVLFLCRSVKSRESDHAQLYMDKKVANGYLPKIEDYVVDCHTRKGKIAGKTKEQFFLDEQEALDNKGKDNYYEKATK